MVFLLLCTAFWELEEGMEGKRGAEEAGMYCSRHIIGSGRHLWLVVQMFHSKRAGRWGFVSCCLGSSLFGCSSGGRHDAAFPYPNASLGSVIYKIPITQLTHSFYNYPVDTKQLNFFPVWERN